MAQTHPSPHPCPKKVAIFWNVNTPKIYYYIINAELCHWSKKGLMANLAMLTVFKSQKTQDVPAAEFVTQFDEIILHSKDLFLFNVDKKAMTEAHFTIKLLTGLSKMIKCYPCDKILKLKSQIYTNCFQSESPKCSKIQRYKICPLFLFFFNPRILEQ